MNPLNYHHLRHFHAVAQCGSLTVAARNLNVAQSAISVQIKQLEASLGAALFEREHKTLTLTEEGRITLDYANTIFRTGNELVATLQNQSGDYRKKLRVGAVATLSRNFQLVFLRDVIADPEVEVIIHSGRLAELVGQLSIHQLDFVLSHCPVPHDKGNALQSHLVDKQPVSLLCHRKLLKKRRFRFPDDLAGIPLILPAQGSDIRRAFDQMIDRSGITPLIAAEADDMAMLRLLAREMNAVALLPAVVVKDEIEGGVLVEAHRIPGLYEHFYALTSKRRFTNPYVKRLLNQSKNEKQLKGQAVNC